MYGLIFDMDGVLADTERISEQAGIRLFREHYRVAVEAHDFHPFIGTGARRYLEGVAEKYGVTLEIPRDVDAANAYFLEILGTASDISFPGVHELIEGASASPEWKLAIATSTPEIKARPTLKAARVNVDHFDVFIHGDLVTHKKPNPEIYFAAARALGLPPAQCVVVEDAITGIQAAKAAGMACVGITNSFPSDRLGQADRVVDSLAEVDTKALADLVQQVRD